MICLDYKRNNCHVIISKYDSADIKRALNRAEISKQNTQHTQKLLGQAM